MRRPQHTIANRYLLALTYSTLLMSIGCGSEAPRAAAPTGTAHLEIRFDDGAPRVAAAAPRLAAWRRWRERLQRWRDERLAALKAHKRAAKKKPS